MLMQSLLIELLSQVHSSKIYKLRMERPLNKTLPRFVRIFKESVPMSVRQAKEQYI